MEDFSDGKGTSEITISDTDDEREYTHLGYSLFHSLVVENEVIQKETNDTEELSDVQKSEIDTLNEVVADIIGGIY